MIIQIENVYTCISKMFDPYYNISFTYRKNVPDYSAGREKNDLGFVVFDMQADIL